MKKIIAVCLTLALSLNISAQTATKETVEKLLVISEASKSMEVAHAQLDQVVKQMEQQMGVTAANKAVFDKYAQKINELTKSEMSWDKVKGPTIDIYMSAMTEEEVLGLIEFYNSPAGKAFVNKMPVITQKSMELSQKLMMEFAPKFQALTTEMAAELKK